MSTIEISLPHCDGSEYVLFPACAYHGNRFDVLKKNYPPMFTPSEAKVNMPVTITDVPRLEKDGSGNIQVTTGDVSVPCVGVFCPGAKKATLVYTIQEINGINLGLAYETGVISISFPAFREQIYRWPHMQINQEPYRPIEADIPHKVIEFDCQTMEDFFRVYFENRKCMGLDDARPVVSPPEKQIAIQRDKFNRMNWRDENQYYDIDANGSWAPGWCGGAMAGYALMKLGGALEKERAAKTLEHLFKNQSPSGLFYGHKNKHNDGYGVPGTENWVLVRKSADCLYFLFKHYALMDDIPPHFITGTKKLADCFVRIWKQYRQFGQFVDCETGEIAVGGSTNGAIVPAGLMSAFRFFGDEKYLTVARESAEMMYSRDARNGYTTGGPCEILQCPDSESAFALLESLVVLYEETKHEQWLNYAEYMAHLCSSWVVSYNYTFPHGSEFHRLDMKTVGSIFANVQNKHSAPGICTLSGDSLLKLYQWTKNARYKELHDDISLTISQYMSTDERPIYSWDVPKDASLLNDDTLVADREKLPQGFMCERVNMSDWESYRCIGGVFNGSCWCETSNLLTLADTAASDAIRNPTGKSRRPS